MVFLVCFHSQHSGNIYIKAVASNIFSNNIQIEDITYYDSANTNAKINNYANSIALRNNGNSNLIFDSDNNAYRIINNMMGSHSIIPITNITGENNFILEFDSYTPDGEIGVSGICIYNDNNNWYGLLDDATREWINTKINGQFSENSSEFNYHRGNWYHYRFTITDTLFKYECMQNNVVLTTYSIDLSVDTIKSTTKYGFNVVWAEVNTIIKNIKVKSL